VAAKNGGRAAKVCGAGGGGCAVFMVREEARERVAEALREAGAHLLPFRVARDGLVVTSVKA
jgi:D-glycero-alpha-D-manno-heptose-7-phosphate kinase